MKRTFAFLLCLISLAAIGQGLNVSWNRWSNPLNPCQEAHLGYLINQGFETPTTGYENCETWVQEGTGVINPAFTGTVLQGTQSLIITNNAGSSDIYTELTATNDEVWAYCLLRPIVVDHGGTYKFIGMYTGTGARLTAVIKGDDTVRVATDGGTASTVSTMSAGTTYNVWIHYKKGSGADAVADVAFSTTGTKPTSGNNFAQFSSGTSLLKVDRIYLGTGSSGNDAYIWDKVRVSNSNIGDNPP